MTKVVQNKIIGIYGLPWQGKTFFATYLASQYKIIYSNVEIMKWVVDINENLITNIKVNNDIKTILDVEKIEYNDTKGIVVLDESGLNINSRRSASEDNMEYARIGMLWRKKNVDILIIAQLEFSVDKYFRELSSYTVEMKSYFDNGKIMFEVTAKNRFGTIISVQNVDLVKWAEKEKYSYNSLESSEIKKKTKKKESEVVAW